jgi:carbohydrate-selective porin OprB
MILGLLLVSPGQGIEEPGLLSRDTLTNGFWGWADRLSDGGVNTTLSVTDVLQQSLGARPSLGRHTARNTGSYDLEVTLDLRTLAGLRGATLYGHVEGSWGRLSLDEAAVGTYFGINADAAGRRAGDVTELWYEQALLNDTLRIRIGKLDITGGFECRGCPVSFDSSAFANDETGQFLNWALVNDPTIPFPWMGLGVILHWNPIEWGYGSVGVVDAEANPHQSGFSTTFNGNDTYFTVAETGVTPRFRSSHGPLQGAYRFGLWTQTLPTTCCDSESLYLSDKGVYFSGDQVLFKENEDPNDGQGAGVFLRCGWAEEPHRALTSFWSAGVQYLGLLRGRDDDVVAVGWAHGTLNRRVSSPYTAGHETAVETYYNARVAGWLAVSPSLQVILHPGGRGEASTVVVAGLRAQIAF